MASIPLPALAIQPPQNPIDQYSKILQMKSMLQNQQLQQAALVGANQENQQRAVAMQGQQTLQKLFSSGNYVTKDENGRPTGFDMDKLGQDALARGVPLSMWTDQQNKYYEGVKNKAAAGSAQIAQEKEVNQQAYQIAEGVRSIQDPAQKQTAYQAAIPKLQALGVDTSKLPPQYPGDDAVKAFESPLGVHAQMLSDAETQAKTAQAAAKAALDQLKAKGLQASPGDVHNMVSAVVPQNWSDPTLAPRTEARINAARALGDSDEMNKALADASSEIGAVKKETNPTVQAQRVATATAEGQARQLVEGMAKPVYAADPKTGQLSLMSQTDALKSGIRTMLPVTSTQVENDTKLINRLGDVHQKIAEYDQALQKPISAKDQGNIAALLGTEGAKLGAFGTEIPMDRLNAALNKENLTGLSANARDQLVAYRNAREAMMGYKTVLSGSARGSDKSMDLLTQALPDPSITDPDFSRRSLDAFKQNLTIVGQGLPRIPGVKSPEEIEAQIKSAAAPPNTNPTTPGGFNWNSMPQHQP
jgi:hypothetical protein